VLGGGVGGGGVLGVEGPISVVAGKFLLTNLQIMGS
jgi:hypothetical protein